MQKSDGFIGEKGIPGLVYIGQGANYAEYCEPVCGLGRAERIPAKCDNCGYAILPPGCIGGSNFCSCD